MHAETIIAMHAETIIAMHADWLELCGALDARHVSTRASEGSNRRAPLSTTDERHKIFAFGVHPPTEPSQRYSAAVPQRVEAQDMSVFRFRARALDVFEPRAWMMFALMLGWSGCGATISQPTDPHGQVEEIARKEAAKHGYFGHLAPGVSDAGQLEEEAEAKPARDAVVDNLGATKDLKLFPLSYVRTADSMMCFHKRLGIGSEQEREAEAKKIGDQWSFVARTHQSLDEVAPGSPWPAPASSTTSYKAELRVLEICTPAPEVTSASRFLTVSAVSKEHAFNNFILVWDFTGKRKE